MTDLKRIPVEIRSAVIMGLAALLITFMVSVLAGNDPGQIIGRTIVMTLVFAVIGLGAMIVLKQFVPEVYNIFSGSFEAESAPPEPEEAVINSQGSSRESTGSQQGREQEKEEVERTDPGEEIPEPGTPEDTREGYDEAFTPLDKEDYPRATVSQDAAQGKMGKHIILDEKKVQYEPKVMAEAIRTIMSRDKE